MKKLVVVGVVLSLVVLLSSSGTTRGFVLLGTRYGASQIDDGGLTLCFDSNSGTLLNYRQNMINGLNVWSEKLLITLVDHGDCSIHRNVNIQKGYYTNPPYYCGGIAGPLAWAINDGVNGYITINAACPDSTFKFSSNLPVPNGQYDLFSIMAHEMGHLYGLDHADNVSGYHLMTNGSSSAWTSDCSATPPGHAFLGRRVSNVGEDGQYLSYDDVSGLGALYGDPALFPGLQDNWIAGVWATNINCDT